MGVGGLSTSSPLRGLEEFPATLGQYQISSFLHLTDCVSATCSFRAVFPADLWLPGFHGGADRFVDQRAQLRASGD